MIPRLYDKATQTFTNAGIGSLSEATKCVVTEELNKSFELELDYPVNGKWIREIKVENIILARPADGENPQPFRIYSVQKNLDGMVNVKAEHLVYTLTKAVVSPIVGKMSVQDLLLQIAQNTTPQTNIALYTNITDTTQKEVEWDVPRTVWNCLLGEENSVIHIYSDGYSGGEWKFDQWSATLMEARGQQKDYTISYGRDMTAFDSTEDMTDVFTAAFPYWKDGNGNTQTLSDLGSYDDVYESEFVPLYQNPLVVPLDMSEYYDNTLSDADLADLIQEQTRVKIIENITMVATQNTHVEFVPLWMTGEYSSLPIQHVKLGDTITVAYRQVGFGVYAKVIKTEYDAMSERYISIDVGANREDFTQVIYKIAKRSK